MTAPAPEKGEVLEASKLLFSSIPEGWSEQLAHLNLLVSHCHFPAVQTVTCSVLSRNTWCREGGKGQKQGDAFVWLGFKTIHRGKFLWEPFCFRFLSYLSRFFFYIRKEKFKKKECFCLAFSLHSSQAVILTELSWFAKLIREKQFAERYTVFPRACRMGRERD